MRGLSEANGSWKIICIVELRACAPAPRRARRRRGRAQHRALARRQDAGDHAAERRLAAARFADQADHLARRRPRRSTPSTACTTSSRMPAPSRLRDPAGEVERLDEALARRRAARAAARVMPAPRSEVRMTAAQRRASPAVLESSPASVGAGRRRRAGSASRKAQPGGRSSSDGVMPGICASGAPRAVAARHRAEQPARVGMQRRVEHVVDRAAARRCGRHTSRRCGRRARRPPTRSCVIQISAVPVSRAQLLHLVQDLRPGW